jgi:hypothetical protein
LARIGFVCGVCLLVGWLFNAAWAADDSKKTIQGTIRIRAGLAHHISPTDRLIIKLFHLGNGVELDAKYAILPTFTLPVEFRIAPTFDMSGRSKWRSYVVEAFTDKDSDVLSVVPGELFASTPGLVPLGTAGVTLELNTLRK